MVYSTLVTLRRKGYQGRSPWLVSCTFLVAQAKLATGEYAPLIAADAARLESMMPAARGLAKANNLKMRLIKLTNRIDIEDIVP